MKQRKSLRLKGYDYANGGLYFITICTFEKKYILSAIVDRRDSPCGCPQVRLTTLGKICRKNIRNIEKAFNVKITDYIIMPNHIHLIVELENYDARTGASPVPTVSAIIGAYKSLVYNEWLDICKKNNRIVGKIWERSFYDHIIRDDEDLFFRKRYIEENPLRWCLKINNKEELYEFEVQNFTQ